MYGCMTRNMTLREYIDFLKAANAFGRLDRLQAALAVRHIGSRHSRGMG